MNLAPRSFDLVLGGKTTVENTAVVLGGRDAVYRRWSQGSPEERADALVGALKLGAEGLTLVQQATQDHCPVVRRRACQLLWTREKADSYWLMDHLVTLAGHTKAVSGIALHQGGNLMISCGYDRTIRIWERSTGKLLHKCKDHTDLVTAIVLSPDQRTLISASRDRTIRVWDIETGILERTITGHSGYVNSVAITPDGTTIVTGSQDSTIKLWQLSTGTELQTIKAHTNLVNAVALSPDGKTIVSCSWNTMIRVWDRETGQLRWEFVGHSARVWAFA